MISTLSEGFLLGLAYAMPIGTQNLFVINSAARGTMPQAVRTAMIFAFMDISLGIACILGVGNLIQSHDMAKPVIGSIGAGFLLYIGYRLLTKKADVADSQAPSAFGSLWKAAFLLTWCNPHALIDGSVLLGGYQSALSQSDTYIFSIGLALASSTWFFSLSTIVNRFNSHFTPRGIGWINRVCGMTMIVFGIKLALSVTAA